MDLKYTRATDIPVEKWGRDHWSLLGYVRSIAIHAAGFKVWADPRMRIARAKYNLMGGQSPGIPMDEKYGSRLNDGSYVPGHDDIDCLWDFCKAGLLTTDKVHEREAGRRYPSVRAECRPRECPQRPQGIGRVVLDVQGASTNGWDQFA